MQEGLGRRINLPKSEREAFLASERSQAMACRFLQLTLLSAVRWKLAAFLPKAAMLASSATMMTKPK